MWLFCFLTVITCCLANEKRCDCDDLVNRVLQFQRMHFLELEIYKQKTNALCEWKEKLNVNMNGHNNIGKLSFITAAINRHCV